MKKAFVLSSIVATTIFLAACSAPEPEETTLDFFDGSETQNGTQLDSSELVQSSDSYQLQSMDNDPASSKGNMKQLSDFEPIEANSVTLTTTKGDITFELNRQEAPLTTINFLTLAKEGFYDGIVFHRVIPDFMAQVGDPLTKDPAKEDMWGTGGPGYTIPDEFDPGLSHDSAGIVSMANAGPNTGGSQFFITYGPTEWLDGKHAVFGKVTAGMDVLEQIEIGDKIVSVSYQ